MRQAVRVLAVLTIGSFLMLTPVTVAGSAAPPAAVVHAQAAPPTDEQPAAELPQPGPEDSGPDLLGQDRRYAIGLAGAALIAFVLLMRKLRGKTYFGLNWRKRG
ncbi:hypothetical protein [Haloactinomyces albus]|uniref:MYXO-CTERM domain-containing protein n=1 Tax=Haloactinomyces albus TaxID=1352928 RepID=A0AAE3ZCI9_9ACTN|nr:hypothetical protein [Haloactinomyces albus]MDR7301350.1 hypothetical protein [Haloactinomyces albus]